MEIMDGLAGTLAGMKEDALVAAKMGGGVVLGAGVAHFVTGFLNNMGAAPVADAAKEAAKGGVSGVAAGSTFEKAAWVPPLVPVVVGLFLFSRFRDQYPALAGASGLGMMGYGLGSLAKQALNKLNQKAVADYIPFGAVDTYESNILAGLGADMSINRYLNGGLGYNDRSSGAPVMVEQVRSLASAPTEFQNLAAAPMTSSLVTMNGLHGLSATLM